MIHILEYRLHDGDDTRPLLEKYGVHDRKKEAKMISLDFKLFPNSQDLTYTALITEVEHGKFELKVVQHKPVDPDKIIGPTKHDIVLPGRYVKSAIAIVILLLCILIPCTVGNMTSGLLTKVAHPYYQQLSHSATRQLKLSQGVWSGNGKFYIQIDFYHLQPCGLSLMNTITRSM